MDASVLTRKKLPLVPIVVCVIVVIGLVLALRYLSGPVTTPANSGRAAPEARAYVGNLALSDVTMQATENFMQQRVVEIQGKITNKGSRPLESVDVYCLFYGMDGREVHRERLPIVPARSAALTPHETRPFRLPFDNLPDGWNQTMPRLVIAQIVFAK
jgi:hypothetical protein